MFKRRSNPIPDFSDMPQSARHGLLHQNGFSSEMVHHIDLSWNTPKFKDQQDQHATNAFISQLSEEDAWQDWLILHPPSVKAPFSTHLPRHLRPIAIAYVAASIKHAHHQRWRHAAAHHGNSGPKPPPPAKPSPGTSGISPYRHQSQTPDSTLAIAAIGIASTP